MIKNIIGKLKCYIEWIKFIEVFYFIYFINWNTNFIYWELDAMLYLFVCSYVYTYKYIYIYIYIFLLPSSYIDMPMLYCKWTLLDNIWYIFHQKQKKISKCPKCTILIAFCSAKSIRIKPCIANCPQTCTNHKQKLFVLAER